jgi:serine/threonine-protein kinase
VGKRSEADRELVTLEQTAGSAMAYQVAQIYVMRHEKDQAFVWLERAYRQHDGGLPYLRIDPKFVELRSDARYQNLVQRLGLAD